MATKKPKRLIEKLTPKQHKYYFDREVEEIKTFESEADFIALREASTWLYERNYCYGSLSCSLPVLIAKGEYYNYPQKWDNLCEEDKLNATGVILSEDFRNGVVKVVIFKPKEISFETNL